MLFIVFLVVHIVSRDVQLLFPMLCGLLVLFFTFALCFVLVSINFVFYFIVVIYFPLFGIFIYFIVFFVPMIIW